MSNSMIHNWATALGFRFQGTLLTGVRGSDTSSRHSPDKKLVRLYRGLLLKAHCGDVAKSASFMCKWNKEFAMLYMSDIVSDHDNLPHHYLMHLIHSWQIVGYFYYMTPKSSSDIVLQSHLNEQALNTSMEVKNIATWFYGKMCQKFHMNAESIQQLVDRLSCDEDTFASRQ